MTDSAGIAPDSGEVPPFFDLVISDLASSTYTMSWSSDTAACGAVSTSHTVTGTSDYDYIAYSGVDWTFDLTTLANRDVVSYEL